MKVSSMKIGFVLLFGVFMVSSIMAQIPENIITEASNPLESDYLDDVVPTSLMMDGKILPYSTLPTTAPISTACPA